MPPILGSQASGYRSIGTGSYGSNFEVVGELALLVESATKRGTLQTWREACFSDSTTRVVESAGAIRSAGADERH
jgi:hypothetical protein